MALDERLICSASALEEGGHGVRFQVDHAGRVESAFVIRYNGRAHAYLNRCGHIPMELDWQPGRFFDAERRLILCATHGAAYDPASGYCLGGPCGSVGLVPVDVIERDGGIYAAGALISAPGDLPTSS